MSAPRPPATRRDFLCGALGMAGLSGSQPRRAFGATAGAVPTAIEAQVGEMVMMGFRGAAPADPGAAALEGWIRRGLVGGVLYFEDNLPSPEAVIRLNRAFQGAAGGRKLYLGVDQEGGAVVRLRADRGFAALPAAAEVATLPPEEAAALYDHTAAELHRLGCNLNFGPVVDLALNRNNPIVAGLGRSYGADPATVVRTAKIFVDAHRHHHVLTALKHFPGHGSSALDSHLALPDITGRWSRAELQPFAELTNAGYADMVMVGHLVHAELTEPHRPASLSRRAVQGLLRDQLGYSGVVVSDDMQMGALRQNFSPDDAILLGLEAGVDLFVFSNREHPDSEMPARFHRVVRAALVQGRLDPTRLQQSLARIARLKRAIPQEAASLIR